MLFLRNYFGDIRTFLYIIEVLNYKDIRSVLELGTYNIQSLREILLRTEDPQMINVKGVFYYDETNNGRKFWLKRKDGFNSSEMENFILGGVMHYNDKSSADIDKLFRDLSIQKTATEVKLKHLASGDFLECLNSSKLIFFLNWLYKSDLYLHYSSINNFYFSLVDIVDSCLGDIEKKAYGKHEMDMLKSELFRLASDNFEDFYNFLYSYDYPNIKPDKVSSFCDHIIGMIEMSEKTFWTECLMQLIKVGKKKEGLIFLENNKNLTTIDNYLHIYIRPIYTFINSYHILDNEDHIEKLLAEIELNYGHVKLNNYNFLDSKKSKMIWISDIIIGLVGKYFTYVNDIKIQDIDDSLNRLTKNQKKCLSLFNRIIIKSHNKNYMLIHSSISRYEHEKVGKILNWI